MDDLDGRGQETDTCDDVIEQLATADVDQALGYRVCQGLQSPSL